MPKFHTAYEPPPQVEFINEEPSLTQQSFAEECDMIAACESAFFIMYLLNLEVSTL